MALAGRVAEELVFGDMDTGAASDLDKVTDMARAMVCEFGMSERLGPLRLGRRHGNPFLGRDVMEDRDYSEEVAQAIDEEVRSIIDRNYQRAKKILTENRDAMDRVVTVLMAKETIERDEFLAILNGQEIAETLETQNVEPPRAGPTYTETEPPRQQIQTRFRPEPGPA